MRLNEMIAGDARNLLEYLPHDSPIVDLVLTSPPYGNMKDYDHIENQIGFGQTNEEYLKDIEQILGDCYKITKETGSLWLIVDTYRKNGRVELLPFQLGEKAKNVGWKLREIITWDKHYSLPWHQKGQMRNTSEYILFLTKSDDYKFFVDRIKTIDEISKWWVDFPERFNPKGKTPTNIWRFPMRRRGTWPDQSVITHLCPFPTGLVTRIVELTTNPGDLVFDPFAGSGIVLAQAENLDRNFLGIEINPKYAEMYHSKVRNIVQTEWKAIKEQRENLETANIHFEETILKLRALKYTRKVLDAFINALEKEERAKLLFCVSTASLPKNFSKGDRIGLDIWFLGLNSHRIFTKGRVAAQERLSLPPLSHFGVDARLHTSSIDNFLDVQSEMKQIIFYSYDKTRVRRYSEKRNLDEWLSLPNQQNRNGISSIRFISNLDVNVAWVLN